MIDRLFTLTLTFAVLCGATLAIGGEFFSSQTPQPSTPSVAVLPRVVITGEVQPAQRAMASAEDEISDIDADNAQSGQRVR